MAVIPREIVRMPVLVAFAIRVVVAVVVSDDVLQRESVM